MCRHTLLLLALATLVLMGSLLIFIKQEDDLSSCSGTAPCSLAFLSTNPLSLRCPAATEALEDSVYWQYQDLSQPQTKPRTFIRPGHLRVDRGPMGQLGSRANLRRGSLIINTAWTSDTGLYLCKSSNSILAAYLVDVQDSSLLYVSHQGLGESILPNQSLRVNLGSSRHMVRLYTRWEPWQDCDRCKVMGEQKMMGFCYAELSEEIDDDKDEDEELEVNGATLPCGLMELHIGQSLPRRGAELHYRICREPCKKEELPAEIVDWWWMGRETAFDCMEPRVMLLETVHLKIHDKARMTCPGASVYTPVLWQRDSTFITRGGNFNGTHRLDDATGGGIYKIENVMPFDSGIYRCWVQGRKVASFHLKIPKQPVVHRRLSLGSNSAARGGRRCKNFRRRLLNGMRIIVRTIAVVLVIRAVTESLRTALFYHG